MKHFFLQHFYICVVVLRVLSCILVLAGIYLLTRGHRLLQKSFSGSLLLEIPLTGSAGECDLPKAGLYAIWQKGGMLVSRPIETIRPHIVEGHSNTEVPLRASLSGRQFSNNTEGRIAIYAFEALAGPHKLVIESGLPLSKLDAYMEGIFPLPVDEAATFLQIRQTQPASQNLIGFVLLLLGVIVVAFGLLLIAVVEWGVVI